MQAKAGTNALHAAILASGPGIAAALLLWMMAVSACAHCTRTIVVPVAPIGQSIVIDADNISGVYPDLMRAAAPRAGCRFELIAVPRARQEQMFDSGAADLLIPASQSPRRDEVGEFVPLIRVRPTLISLQSARGPLHSLKELIDDPQLRLALVRGFDYGPAYQDLLDEMGRRGRLSLEADVTSVARALNAGSADVTLMVPAILIGAISSDARLRALVPQLRIEPLDELPWRDSGVYIGRSNSLPESDRLQLRDLFEGLVRSGDLWRAFQKTYSPAALLSVQPR